MIHVFLPSQLESYTGAQREIQLDPQEMPVPLTLACIIDTLDRQFRGMAFRIVDEHGRIRRHIAIFVGETLIRDLSLPLAGDERIQIVGALSGG